MNKIWFTSDWHFLHFNIIEYCSRPFLNEEEMNEIIINNYVSYVNENDTVFFLGDLTIKRGSSFKPLFKELFLNLPGNKHLLIGNHDYFTKEFYKESGFLSVNRRIETSKFIMVHDPASFTATDKNSAKMLVHGHVHSLEQRDSGMFDCGVDANNFYPVLKKDIIEYFRSNDEIPF